MSVRVTDTRIVITEADNTTGWTGADQATSEFFAEAPNAIQSSQSPGSPLQIYYTDATPRDVSGSLVYVYVWNNAVQDPWQHATLPPQTLHLGDGTNRISLKMAGQDRRVFNHLDGPTGFQNLVIDGSMIAAMNAAGLVIARAGSLANYLTNIGSTTMFGGDFATLSKALAGGNNLGVDIIRIGKHGLRITSGSSADPGKFSQIVTEDASTANLKAHGIIRTYTTGIYGAQGPLTFGSQSATFPTYFSDSGITLAFENRNINNDKYYLKVTGSATADTTFILRNSTIATAGPHVYCNFSGSSAIDYIRKLELTGNSFSNLTNRIDFANNYSSSFHTASQNVFSGCGIINVGNAFFDSNTIQTGVNPSGSLLLNSSSAAYQTEQTDNMANLTFIASGTVGHAIYMTEAEATYSFNNFTYDGFGANETENSSVYNNSAGAVLINIIGGETPTVRNGGGATTTLSSPATLTLTGMVSGTEVTITSGSIPTVLFNVEDVDGAGEAAYPYTDTAGQIVDILIFHIDYDPNLSSIYGYTLLNEDATIPIQQILDRNYNNP